MRSRGKTELKSRNKSETGPQYLILRDQMALNIELGKLPPGTRLPSERKLQSDSGALPRALDAEAARALPLERVRLDEPAFRFALNEDAMATEKLAEGIRAFAADSVKLDALIEAGK